MNLRKIVGVLSLLTAGVLVGGCASVRVTPVSVAQVNDPSIAGVRFYQPQPYLLVTEMPARPMEHMPMMNGIMRPGMMHPPMGHQQKGRGIGHKQQMMKNHHGMWDKNAPKGRHEDRMMHGQKPDALHHGNHQWNNRPNMGKMGNMIIAMRPPERVFKLEIIYLPDYSHPYVANIQGGLGHSPNSILLANGWELLGLNVKGHVTQSRPITAITAVPAKTHPGLMMHGKNMWQHGKKASHKHAAGDARQWGHHPSRGMMHHPMMLPRHAAMAMGLHPGLYQFVFSPKTGKLAGLRCIRLLKPHHWHAQGAKQCPIGKAMRHHDGMPPTTAPAAAK